MRANIKYALPAGRAKSMGFRHANATIFHCSTGRSLTVIGIALLVISMVSVSQSRAAGQAGPSTDSRIRNLDSRWIPWIGSWRLISNITQTGDLVETSKNLLEIKPGDDGKSVVMKGFHDKEVLYDEKKVVVDGSRRPLKDNDCEGWYKYSWSDTGKRLLFDSELTCPGSRPRVISGISLFANAGEWLDIQMLKSGGDRMITIRRYRQASGNQNIPVERSAAEFARVAAGANLSIDEIIELTHKVAPEVIEAALVELRKPFQIDSEVLERLADADVSSRVVDLMVAVSYPERFTIEQREAEPARRPQPRLPDTYLVYPYAWAPFGMWSYYDPFFPWYWPSASWLYGYWGWGWSGYPIYVGRPGHGGGYRVSGGRLVAGKGYSRVQPSGPRGSRYAVPRGVSRIVNGVTRSGSSPARTPSGGGGSGASAGSSGRSGGGSSSASPRGYSGGGSGRARPRN